MSSWSCNGQRHRVKVHLTNRRQRAWVSTNIGNPGWPMARHNGCSEYTHKYRAGRYSNAQSSVNIRTNNNYRKTDHQRRYHVATDVPNTFTPPSAEIPKTWRTVRNSKKMYAFWSINSVFRNMCVIYVKTSWWDDRNFDEMWEEWTMDRHFRRNSCSRF